MDKEPPLDSDVESVTERNSDIGKTVTTNGNDTLAGLTTKDYALIIVLFALAFVFIVVGIGLAAAMASGSLVEFTGSFNLDEYQAAVLLLVGAGVTMVTQQLTTRQNVAARKNLS